jgi:hypothetical protein
MARGGLAGIPAGCAGEFSLDHCGQWDVLANRLSAAAVVSPASQEVASPLTAKAAPGKLWSTAAMRPLRTVVHREGFGLRLFRHPISRNFDLEHANEASGAT